ncbi:MAG: TlyA family RNA methyltransferase [Desulfobacterales bacterium]|nr:MAG: TlyA family RNA methyltransferase [Desulfobacterales bacterium]
MSAKKTRLDLLIVEKGLAPSRQKARALIMAGKVLVNHQPIEKPGTLIYIEDHIIVKEEASKYVSRGGLKLEKVIQALKTDISGLVCLDVGAATGGFTDCLLQHGASRVFAVDVGYGQLAWKLRQDPRVVVIERTNIRSMPAEMLPQRVDLVTIDVSFISLKIVVPAVLKFMKKNALILALIKPQFEVGKGHVGKGGVVRDPALHAKVIDDLSVFFSKTGLAKEFVIPSPILGPKGNKEFFISLKL